MKNLVITKLTKIIHGIPVTVNVDRYIILVIHNLEQNAQNKLTTNTDTTRVRISRKKSKKFPLLSGVDCILGKTISQQTPGCVEDMELKNSE